MRAQELTARTLAPGSPLACLDAVAGENVEAACEKALFALPQRWRPPRPMWRRGLSCFRTWPPMSNTAARISTARCCRCGIRSRPIASASWRTRLRCATAAPARIARRSMCLHDASRVRANLSGQTLDRYLDRYLTAWAQQPDGPGPVADAAPQSQPTYQPGAPGPRKVGQHRLPHAASIPPVSIMNPEPGTKPTPAAAAAANPNPPAPAAATASAPPPKKSRKQAANPPAQAPHRPPRRRPRRWSSNRTRSGRRPRLRKRPRRHLHRQRTSPAAGPVQLNPFGVAAVSSISGTPLTRRHAAAKVRPPCSAPSSSPIAAKSPAASRAPPSGSGCARLRSIRRPTPTRFMCDPCDEAYFIGPAPARESYLAIERIDRGGARRPAPNASIRATAFCPRTPISPRPATKPASPSSGRRPRRSAPWGSRIAPRR